MAATDITRAQLATLFGSALTSIALGSINYDLTAGKWCAFVGDDGGTPVLKGVGDTLEELESYIGPQATRSVAEGTGAYFICYIPKGMG